MVNLVKIHKSLHRNSCKCNKTLIVTVNRGLLKTEGFEYDGNLLKGKG